MELLEFSTSSAVAIALYVSCGVPLILMCVSRLRSLRSRNAVQFLLAQGSGFLLWGFLVAQFGGDSVEEIVAGFLLLASAALVYLEIWALISRGYTLGVLVTLLSAGRPLQREAIAAAYRQGAGLSWIMQHRLAGLLGAGLVNRRDDVLSLTPRLGVSVALLYRLALQILALRSGGE